MPPWGDNLTRRESHVPSQRFILKNSKPCGRCESVSRPNLAGLYTLRTDVLLHTFALLFHWGWCDTSPPPRPPAPALFLGQAASCSLPRLPTLRLSVALNIPEAASVVLGKRKGSVSLVPFCTDTISQGRRPQSLCRQSNTPLSFVKKRHICPWSCFPFKGSKGQSCCYYFRLKPGPWEGESRKGELGGGPGRAGSGEPWEEGESRARKASKCLFLCTRGWSAGEKNVLFFWMLPLIVRMSAFL